MPCAAGLRIYVVDNGSTDGTGRIAERAGATATRLPERGYGRACAAGARRAIADGATIVAFMDGDFADHPEELPLVLSPIVEGRADLVVGSRLRGGMARGAMPWHQRLGNRVVSAMLRRLYGLPITDLGPFRAIRAEALERLCMSEPTYGWTTEMLAKAGRCELRVLEVSVRYRARIGVSKISGTVRGTIGATYYLLTRTVRFLAWEPPV